MDRVLTGFLDELTKVSYELRNPYGKVQTKIDKLLKGGKEKYLGPSEVRSSVYPPMGEVANRPAAERQPKLDFRPPKPPG